MTIHPEIELVIENSIRPLDLENESFNAAVRVDDGKWPGVTTPETVRRLKLRRPADIARAPMIHVVPFPLAWPIWLREAGAGTVKTRQAIWVDSFEAALQLAERGAGVALGLVPLFAEREAAGALCRPIARSSQTGSYWLVHRPEERTNIELRAFKRWLLAELATNS